MRSPALVADEREDHRPGSPLRDLDATNPQIVDCPSCSSRHLHYGFTCRGFRVVECSECGLMMLNPQPNDRQLADIYGADYFLGDSSESGLEQVSRMKRATARVYLADLEKYRGTVGGRLLEIGCGAGDFLHEALDSGYQVTGIEINADAVRTARRALSSSARIIHGTIDAAGMDAGPFDVAVLSDVIEHVREPIAFLHQLRRVLAPDAVLLITTPSLDSWTAKLLKQNWMEFKLEHLYYFDPFTIQNVLLRAGFGSITIRPNRKMLSLDYIARHFERYPVPVLAQIVRTFNRALPAALTGRAFPIVASGMNVFARAAEVSSRKLLSIVVVAYNEAPTIEILLNRVLAKSIQGIDTEVIVVESNSTDGTREIVEKYRAHPKVRLIFENGPRGKGHAVRTGLTEARGDFILIQDADLEYDVEDYDVLLEPLMEGRAAFVLGARHGGKAWKMRQFEGQWLTSKFMNAGHWFFTSLVNVLFSMRLRDPFTMYKVFRRDCLYGLTFHCNRFDFDFELLTKLVRKGYRPMEIPVNYRSRSFSEGKKVSVLRDPLNWLWALVKLRFERIDPLETIRRAADR
ncbi:MAG TPA: glycosyltransferase [Casimicrobiaceae bacterium]|jgi:SAM-dependent methyltransferase